MYQVEQPPLLVTEEQIVAPLVGILEEITPKSENSQQLSPQTTQSFKESLDKLFPEQQYEEKSIQRAKDILGGSVVEFSPEQLKDAITEVQFLAESWVDDFEREIFGGLTLQEVLHEKGGI